MKLSIIIPYYNAEPYTSELLDVLNPQINDEVEVIVVDDGSTEKFKTDYKWCKVIHKKNGGCATARNRGLNKAKGDYVSFIDADDLIPEYFISKLFETIDKTNADVIDFSWKSLSKEGTQHDHKLNANGWLTNPSVCTRAFKRSFIGDVRFNEKKDSTEDEDFSRKIGYLDKSTKMIHAAIPEYMYFYRTAVTDSKIKRFKKGLMKTKRVVYYFNHIKSDMTWLLEEIKKEDEVNEVWLLTHRCDIPELKRYCQISQPIKIWAHYLRGEKYSNCEIVHQPIKTQVVLYCEYANKVGGISTFLYNFCQHMKRHYDIMVLYDKMDAYQVSRLMSIVPVMKVSSTPVVCDTIILNRLTDKIPENVTYKQSIQIVHACSQVKLDIPQDRDQIVNVSQAAKDSWGEQSKDGIVIHNPSWNEDKESLFLISATRISAKDKGSNDSRMRILANKLVNAGIPYVWLNFSDIPLKDMPQGFVNMPSTLDIQPFIKRADYLVQLSDEEAYSMAILEALTNNTAVLSTPFKSLLESGFIDEKTGYIVPYDMDFDVMDLLNVPQFDFEYDNNTIINQWRSLLGDGQPTNYHLDMVKVRVTMSYKDVFFNQQMEKGMIINMPVNRAEELKKKGLVE